MVWKSNDKMGTHLIFSVWPLIFQKMSSVWTSVFTWVAVIRSGNNEEEPFCRLFFNVTWILWIEKRNAYDLLSFENDWWSARPLCLTVILSECVAVISDPEVIPQVAGEKKCLDVLSEGHPSRTEWKLEVGAHLSLKPLHGNQGWMAAVSLETKTNRTCSLITNAHLSQQRGRVPASVQHP